MHDRHRDERSVRRLRLDLGCRQGSGIVVFALRLEPGVGHLGRSGLVVVVTAEAGPATQVEHDARHTLVDSEIFDIADERQGELLGPCRLRVLDAEQFTVAAIHLAHIERIACRSDGIDDRFTRSHDGFGGREIRLGERSAQHLVARRALVRPQEQRIAVNREARDVVRVIDNLDPRRLVAVHRGQRRDPQLELPLHAVDGQCHDIGRPQRIGGIDEFGWVDGGKRRNAGAKQQHVVVGVLAQLVQVDALILIFVGDGRVGRKLLQPAVFKAPVGKPRRTGVLRPVDHIAGFFTRCEVKHVNDARLRA